MDQIKMKEIYYDPTNSTSFGGVRSLTRQTNANAKKWLSSQDTYTLHKPIRRKFPRRKTFAKGIDDLFQADLADMQNVSRYNNGYRYILTCIDVFSKRAFAIPLKDKRGPSVAEAFEKIFTERTPVFLQTDRGTEFLNSQVQSVFRKYNIKHYSSFNYDIKAACVERFNRTIKTKLFRYFTHSHSNRWVDVLPSFIESYNKSFHRTIGMAPNEVTIENTQQVADRMYPAKTPPNYKFHVGDHVRISKYKNVFTKGYLQNWTDEIFKIAVRHSTSPVTYGLVDLLQEDIKGKFYEPELQLVVKQADDVYIVEKIIKTRRRNGKLEYFVKWKGYPDKFNSWTTNVRRL
jgi:hypothetical protein